MAERILVVEDDTTIRVTLRDVLQKQGYQVDLAEDGAGWSFPASVPTA